MKRSDNIAWSQLRVGLFIMIALIFGAVGILLMGKQTKLFIDKGRLSVLMKDVAGLKVGAPVWLAGIDVGAVTGVGFENPKKTNEVEVSLEIDKEALKKIGADSSIAVKTRGLMGEKYVDITPSQFYSETPPTRLVGTSTAKLEDVMQKASGSFDMLNRMIARVEKGEGSLGKFTNDPRLYDNLQSLTKELNVFAVRMNSGEGTLGKLTQSREPYDRLMAILNRVDGAVKDIQNSQGTMGKLIHDRELYDRLNALAGKGLEAAEGVRELNGRLLSKEGTLGLFINDPQFYQRSVGILDRAEKSLSSLEDVAARVKAGEGTAGKILTKDDLHNRLNATVDSVNDLVKDIKSNPKRYLKISIF